MKYMDWVKKHGQIDHLVRGVLPDEKEVGKMTHDELIQKFGHKIMKVAEELGIELTEFDLIEIQDRIYGVPDPPFHKSHYDLHS